LDETLRGLHAIPGVGATTADYIAMRVYREPDAFPTNDQQLRAAASSNSTALGAIELEARAERWRPWRAYAAMCLWAAANRDDTASPAYFQGNRETIRPPAPEQVA
jgi:AraC family transcriptional regulator of adaptative response / DNA-3-methyladenine glycosylase II